MHTHIDIFEVVKSLSDDVAWWVMRREIFRLLNEIMLFVNIYFYLSLPLSAKNVKTILNYLNRFRSNVFVWVNRGCERYRTKPKYLKREKYFGIKSCLPKKAFSSFLLLVFIKVYEGQYKTVINGIWTFDVYDVISGGLDKF